MFYIINHCLVQMYKVHFFLIVHAEETVIHLASCLQEQGMNLWISIFYTVVARIIHSKLVR